MIELIKNLYGMFQVLCVRAIQCFILGWVAYPLYDLCVVPTFGTPKLSFFQVVGICLLVVVVKIVWGLERNQVRR